MSNKFKIFLLSVLGFFLPLFAHGAMNTDLFNNDLTGYFSSTSSQAFTQNIAHTALSTPVVSSITLVVPSSTVDTILSTRTTNNPILLILQGQTGDARDFFFNGYYKQVHSSSYNTTWYLSALGAGTDFPEASTTVPMSLPNSNAPYHLTVYDNQNLAKVFGGSITCDSYPNGSITYNVGPTGNLCNLVFAMTSDFPVFSSGQDPNANSIANTSSANVSGQSYGVVPGYDASQGCTTATSTMAGLGCLLYEGSVNLANFLFVPPQGVRDILDFEMHHFSGGFPFSIFFDYSNFIHAGTIGNISDNSITLTLPSPTPGTFTVSSSTLYQFLGGASNWTLIRQYETAGIWLVFSLGVLSFLLY